MDTGAIRLKVEQSMSLLAEIKMKQIFVLLWVAMLAGCATQQPKISLSESEQQQIKEGKLLKFSDKIVNQSIDPIKASMMGDVVLKKSSDRIFVCAVPALFTEGCFPHLSAKMAKYFSDKGIKVTNDAASADKKVFVVLSYNYSGAAFNNSQLPYLEKSLEKNDTLDIGAEDAVADKKRQDEQIKEDKKNFLWGLAGIALATAAGGASPMQQANGVSTASGNNHIHGDANNKKKVLWIEVQTKSGSEHVMFPTRETALIYTGPVDLQHSFAQLFDEAMKDLANDIVVN